MSLGRPKAEFSLSHDEATALQQWVARQAVVPVIAQRARIVLLCSAGRTNAAVARELGVREHTVGLWRRRFLEQRLAGLLDQPRPGAPKRIDPDDVRRRLTSILIQRPPSGKEWTIRRLAAISGLSPATVHRTWKELFTRAHRETEALPAADRILLERTVDIAGLHLTAQRGALALAVAPGHGLGRRPEHPRLAHARGRAVPRVPVSPAAALVFAALAQSIAAPRRHEEDADMRAFLEHVEGRAGAGVHLVAQLPREAAGHAALDGSRGVTLAERERWIELVERWLAALALKYAADGTCAALAPLVDALRSALAQEPPYSCTAFTWFASPVRACEWVDLDEWVDVDEREEPC